MAVVSHTVKQCRKLQEQGAVSEQCKHRHPLGGACAVQLPSREGSPPGKKESMAEEWPSMAPSMRGSSMSIRGVFPPTRSSWAPD